MTTALRLTDVLTPRQMEVVSLMAEGLTNREIAAQLVLEEATVNRHIGAIFARLNLGPKTGRIQVALRYMRERAEAEWRIELGAAPACPGHLICRGQKVFCA